MTEEPSRRAVLRVAAGIAGTAAAGSAGVAVSGSTAAAESAASAPPVEWQRDVPFEREDVYDLDGLERVVQTADGGYALPGDGYEITETGETRTRFAVYRTDDQGRRQWVRFAGFDGQPPEVGDASLEDGFLTSDEGYGLVGNGDVRYEDFVSDTSVALAAKLGPDGEPQWTRQFDAVDERRVDDGSDELRGEELPWASFSGGAPTADGGFAAGGRYDGSAWFVRFAADGTVDAEQRYDAYGRVHEVDALDAGSLLYVDLFEDPHVLTVDGTGAVRDVVSLENVYDVSRGEVIQTADGGFATAGWVDEDMYLEKLDASGNSEWTATFDGPYQGDDSAWCVAQTDDGGYVLGGRMSEAYSGMNVPAVVRTDANGTEQWRTLLNDADGTMMDVTLTDDGGFVSWGYDLIKFGPLGGDDGSGDDDSTSQDPVAVLDGSDDVYQFEEVLESIEYYNTDESVPDTGGETVSFRDVLEIISQYNTN